MPNCVLGGCLIMLSVSKSSCNFPHRFAHPPHATPHLTPSPTTTNTGSSPISNSFDLTHRLLTVCRYHHRSNPLANHCGPPHAPRAGKYHELLSPPQINSTAKREANLVRREAEQGNSQADGLLPFNKKRQAQDKSPEVTTYQMAYHLAKDYPDLYARAISATKSKPAPNKNFVSDWGDSLKK